LAEQLTGTLFDRGFLPGRDYQLLAVDRVKFMDGSALQLDAMMRDHAQMIRTLLAEMHAAIQSCCSHCNDLRNPMTYIPGMSLHK